ncbi:Kiwa anti-phage protein KwaB-like domain-containing protein [Asticcacaulis taihuensis]|uniref:Kiwa anti-phage protein KwaB-like domain-containing protein n=1 Tax=Asticcacaulis taihuensis TaxID=260084 RepID=UPI003F7C2454
MINEDFDMSGIESVNFGISLNPDNNMYFIPTDRPTQLALKNILSDTVDAFDRIEGEWERYEVSEDYGARRRLFADRSSDLMTDLAAVFDAGALDDLANLSDHISNVEFYFAEFTDRLGRKAVAIKKATRLKGTLKSRNKLVRLLNDTLVLIEDDVLRLDQEFDVIITNEHVFIINVRPMEQTAKISENVAAAADIKIQSIHDAIPFLDLSRIKEKIGRHPRMARHAHSISNRNDLARFQRDPIVALAAQHNIKFLELDSGRLQCRVADEAKLLELLDARRYHLDLTGDGGDPYRASARQKVSSGGAE